MGQNEQLDALRYLSETHRSLHERRQRYEWRIIFTVITFFVTSVGAVYSEKVRLPKGWVITAMIWVLFLAFAFVTVGFLHFIHTANGRNKSFAEDVETQIMALANKQSVATITFSRKGFRKTLRAFYS